MSMAPPRPLASFDEFWPFYVAQHLHPVNRALHVAGTAAALACLAAGVGVSGWYAAGALAAGYGPAWVGHFFVEKNRPATFTHPLWSLLGDFKMFGLVLTGRMAAHDGEARRLFPAGV
jgi:hypothetical protein